MRRLECFCWLMAWSKSKFPARDKTAPGLAPAVGAGCVDEADERRGEGPIVRVRRIHKSQQKLTAFFRSSNSQYHSSDLSSKLGSEMPAFAALISYNIDDHSTSSTRLDSSCCCRCAMRYARCRNSSSAESRTNDAHHLWGWRIVAVFATASTAI